MKLYFILKRKEWQWNNWIRKRMNNKQQWINKVINDSRIARKWNKIVKTSARFSIYVQWKMMGSFNWKFMTSKGIILGIQYFFANFCYEVVLFRVNFRPRFLSTYLYDLLLKKVFIAIEHLWKVTPQLILILTLKLQPIRLKE